MDDQEIIKLQQLLYEFYTQAISNERRREIEEALTNWQQNELSWKLCQAIMAKTNDHYLVMFCLSSMESTINKRWMSLNWQDKKEIKEFMWRFSLQSGNASYVLAKAVKLCVDTAKHDWPHFYPDFFTNFMGLMQNETTSHLGLLYLQTISQELGGSRQDLSVSRNAELQRLLLSQMPAVYSRLLGFLSGGKVDVTLVFDVLSHLFTWVPADQIPQQLVVVIFQIALNTQSEEKAMAALTTLTDMLYRHWTPPCWQQFLQFIVTFLQSPPQNWDSHYLDKMCELLRLVLTVHMSRGADHMPQLLGATLTWTSLHKSLHPGVTSCMQVWSHVLDHPSAYKYGSELVKLADFIIERMQWTHNEQIIQQDDALTDAENELEDICQLALRPCLEVMAKVAELQPEPVLVSVITRWVQLIQAASSLPNNERQVEYLLQDLGTFTRAVGRLSPVWGERQDVDYIRAVSGYLLSLTQLKYSPASETTKTACINVKSEALAAMKACCYCIARLPENEVRERSMQMLDLVLKLLSDRERKLQHSAAHLLLSLTATVRLPGLWELTPLVTNPSSLPLQHLCQEDGYLVVGGVLNCFILNPKCDDSGTAAAAQFVDCLCGCLSDATPSNETAKIDALHLLTYLVRIYESEGSKQKKLLCAIIQKSAESALILYRNSLSSEKLSLEILHFFKTLLECLQTQVGVPFVQSVVQTFLSTYSREKLLAAVESVEGGGLEHLLGILDLVIRTPALSAAGLTPLTISLSLQLSSMLLKDSAPASVQEAYFTLVYSIVEHKWQYLVKGCADSSQRVEEFLGLLRVMGQALLLADINLYRLNLTHFEKLNQRWRLFSTTLFKKDLLGEMLTVLLMTLLNKTHSLLSDDIALAICHLISADPAAFFNLFLPSFLASIQSLDAMQQETLLKNFQREMDLPSLTKNIFRLVNDVTCYQMCNAGQTNNICR